MLETRSSIRYLSMEVDGGMLPSLGGEGGGGEGREGGEGRGEEGKQPSGENKNGVEITVERLKYVTLHSCRVPVYNTNRHCTTMCMCVCASTQPTHTYQYYD